MPGLGLSGGELVITFWGTSCSHQIDDFYGAKERSLLHFWGHPEHPNDRSSFFWGCARRLRRWFINRRLVDIDTHQIGWPKLRIDPVFEDFPSYKPGFVQDFPVRLASLSLSWGHRNAARGFEQASWLGSSAILRSSHPSHLLGHPVPAQIFGTLAL